jgi:hypothetical protein
MGSFLLVINYLITDHSYIAINIVDFCQFDWTKAEELVLKNCQIDDAAWWTFVGNAYLFHNLKKLSL